MKKLINLLVMALICMSCEHKVMQSDMVQGICIGRGIRGTFKPVVQSFEFSVPGEKGRQVEGEVHFTLFWTTGRAKYDLLMVEELAEQKK